RRGIQPDLMAGAFADWKKPVAWWRTLLEALGPLVTEAADGFRVRHNDVRVFLSGKLASLIPAQRLRTISQLADYFMGPDSDRVAAHLLLFDLLRLAQRFDESAEVFTVDWVVEAAALGVDTEQLTEECQSAIRALPKRKRWPLLVSVGCATQTLDRLKDFREY